MTVEVAWLRALQSHLHLSSRPFRQPMTQPSLACGCGGRLAWGRHGGRRALACLHEGVQRAAQRLQLEKVGGGSCCVGLHGSALEDLP